MGNTDIVIIGTGLSGFSLVKEIRKLDKEIQITMITSDDGVNYSKPMISTGFSKNKTADDLALASAEKMEEMLNVKIYSMSTVTKIDKEKQRVSFSKNSLDYDKLVIAWGAYTINPPLEGDAADSVHQLNDLMDYRSFRNDAENKRKVLIIGAGLIGCEYANDLSYADFDIEVVDPMTTVLSSLLPKEASHAIQSALEDKGIKFHFGTTVNLSSLQ